MNIFEEYLYAVVRPMVSNPESVRVESSTDDRGVLLQLSAAQEDMGLIIGRGGATAQSLREILRVFGARQQARISLKIVDPLDAGGSASD